MSDEREGREGEEEVEAEAQEAEGEEEVVDENQELLAKVADPNAMTGTIDTSGAGAATVAEQLETITPTQMAETGHTDELKAVAGEGEGAEAEPQEAEEEEEAEEDA